jgi:ferredoxin
MPIVRHGALEVVCAEGARLRDVLRGAGIAVYADPTGLVNCHGLGTCGTCALHVGANAAPASTALSPPTAVERWRLAFPPHRDGLAAGLRLSCQARVLGDLEVTRWEGFWGHRPPDAQARRAGGG